MNALKKQFKSINFFYVFMVSFLSLLYFILKVKTGYLWPAADMYPFFERQYDATYLANDFYTNSISNEKNPRWIFGLFIIYLADFLNIGWYSVFYYITVLLVFIIPALFYISIFLMLKPHLKQEQLKLAQLILMFGIMFLIYPPINGIFSIAWWRPLFMQTTAQSLSLAIGLVAIIFSQFNSKKLITSGCIFFAISAFLHPPQALFCFAFYLLCNSPFLLKNYKKYTTLFFVIVTVLVFMIFFFKPSASIDTVTYVDIYAKERHSSHYHLEQFGSLTPLSWKFSFFLIIILLLIPALYFFKVKSINLFSLSVMFLLSYSLAVFMQYLFIDVFPNKALASLGPVRFTSFGYWMLIFLWTILLSKIIPPIKLSLKLNYKLILLLSISSILIGFKFIDNPRTSAYNQYNDIFNFINSTKSESVFASAPSNFNTDIPNFSNRAIFIGNGFPFNESYFLEFYDRYTLLYGSSYDDKVGSWKGEQDANFYRNLTPKDFYRISKIYQLDYVLIEKDYISSFDNYKPVFTNEILNIYKVSDF